MAANGLRGWRPGRNSERHAYRILWSKVYRFAGGLYTPEHSAAALIMLRYINWSWCEMVWRIATPDSASLTIASGD
jgi:hypothetical protein